MPRTSRTTWPGLLELLRSPRWLSEAQRKAIHLGAIVLPLGMLYEWLPWPRGRGEWSLLLGGLVLVAVALDLLRIHDRRVERFFRAFVGELLREHESFDLLGSTYLLLAALLAVAIFPQPVAAAALGYAIVGDGMAAVVGKTWGRHPFFHKTFEGAAGGLAACLTWAGYLVLAWQLPWAAVVSGALVATLVELLPIPLDDNLGMPLAAGLAMMLLGGVT